MTVTGKKLLKSNPGTSKTFLVKSAIIFLNVTTYRMLWLWSCRRGRREPVESRGLLYCRRRGAFRCLIGRTCQACKNVSRLFNERLTLHADKNIDASNDRIATEQINGCFQAFVYLNGILKGYLFSLAFDIEQQRHFGLYNRRRAQFE